MKSWLASLTGKAGAAPAPIGENAPKPADAPEEDE